MRPWKVLGVLGLITTISTQPLYVTTPVQSSAKPSSVEETFEPQSIVGKLTKQVLKECPNAKKYVQLVQNHPSRIGDLEYLVQACKENIPVEEIEYILKEMPLSFEQPAHLALAARKGHVPLEDAVRTSRIDWKSPFADLYDNMTNNYYLVKYVENGGTYAFAQEVQKLRSPTGPIAHKELSEMVSLVQEPRAYWLLTEALKQHVDVTIPIAREAVEKNFPIEAIAAYRALGLNDFKHMAQLWACHVTDKQFAEMMTLFPDKERAIRYALFRAQRSEMVFKDTAKPNALITIPVDNSNSAFNFEKTPTFLQILRDNYDLVIVPVATQQDVFAAIELFPPKSIDLFVHVGHGSRTSLAYRDTAQLTQQLTLRLDDRQVIKESEFTTADAQYQNLFNTLRSTARVFQFSCSNAKTPELLDRILSTPRGSTVLDRPYNRENLAEFVKRLAGPERVVFAAKESFSYPDIFITHAYPLELRIVVEGKNVTWRQ